MTRDELTVDIMKNRGFAPCEGFTLEEIVDKIKTLGVWNFLRCEMEKHYYYSDREYEMCATYDVYYRDEFLEVSNDKREWKRVAVRRVETGRHCVYAD